ncbi:MAG: carboxypeptidase-like regulatory domain-containing protein [Bacteroidota bacterium]
MTNYLNKFAILIAVLFILNTKCQAQSRIALNGYITDSLTSEPLAFATIGIKDSPIATISNLEGSFVFHVPLSHQNDTLLISTLGYATKRLSIADVRNKDFFEIKLTQQEEILDAIVIRDTLSAEEIMKLAVERIPINHANFPISMQAFYRETQEVDSSYVSLLEAALTIYDENDLKRYKSPLRTRIRIDQLRRSFGYTHVHNDWWDDNNLLMAAYGQNPIPYDFKALKKGQYKRGDNTTLNDKLVYVINGIADNSYWPETYYIESESYAFVKIEEVYDIKADNAKVWEFTNKGQKVAAKFTDRKLIMDFRKYQDRYYLSSFTFNAAHVYVVDGEPDTHFRIKQDILINDIEIERPSKVARNEATRLNRTLQDNKYTFDEAFWESYNMVQETPLEKRLIDDLQKEAALKEQFRMSKE